MGWVKMLPGKLAELGIHINVHQKDITKDQLIKSFKAIQLNQGLDSLALMKTDEIFNRAYENSPRKDFYTVLHEAQQLTRNSHMYSSLNHLIGIVLQLAKAS